MKNHQWHFFLNGVNYYLKNRSTDKLNNQYYDLIDKCKNLDQQIKQIDQEQFKNTHLNQTKLQNRLTNQLDFIKLKTDLIKQRKCLHKELKNLRSIQLVRQQLNWLKIRQFMHQNFHWLFNYHSFHQMILRQQSIRQILKQNLICFIFDSYNLLNCSLRLTCTKFRLYLRLFYFKLKL